MAQRTIQDIRNILAEDEFEYQQELDGVLVANVGREVEQSKKEVQHRIDTVAKGQVALKLQAKQEMAKLVGEAATINPIVQPPSDSPEPRIVMYRKMSTRKHNPWKADGTLTINGDQATVRDLITKKVVVCGSIENLTALLDGDETQIESYDIILS